MIMERIQFQNYWAALVRIFKDDERKQDVRYYDSELLAQSALDYIRYTRIRQWTLFVQRRGEEFERMVEKLQEKGLALDAITRFVENEKLWEATLEMAVL
jgi:hypothetical protein